MTTFEQQSFMAPNIPNLGTCWVRYSFIELNNCFMVSLSRLGLIQSLATKIFHCSVVERQSFSDTTVDLSYWVGNWRYTQLFNYKMFHQETIKMILSWVLSSLIQQPLHDSIFDWSHLIGFGTV